MTIRLQEITKRVVAADGSIAKLCREAGIARSTWDRWVRGDTSPNLMTLEKVEAACGRLEAAFAAETEKAA